MKINKLLLIGLISSGIVLSACGASGATKENKLHDAYAFSKIEKTNGQGADVVLNQYTNAYMEFNKGEVSVIGDEYYRFAYSVSMEYGGSTMEQSYEEYGTFDGPFGGGPNDSYIEHNYSFTLVNGIRSKAESSNKLSYEICEDSLRVTVVNGDFTVGSFLMTNVEKRVPSYVSDANYFAKIDLGYTYYPEGYFDKYIDSKAYVGESNEFYFTYRQGNNICKEIGVITDSILNTHRGSAEDPIYEIQISKVVKYQHDEQISEETVELSRGIVQRSSEFGEKMIAVYVDYGNETRETSIVYRQNASEVTPEKPR